MIHVNNAYGLDAVRSMVFRSLASLRLADLDDDLCVRSAQRSLDDLRGRNRITSYDNCRILRKGEGEAWLTANLSWDRGFQGTTVCFPKGSLTPEMVDVADVMES